MGMMISFVLGGLAVVAVILVAVIIVSFVRINKLRKGVDGIWDRINDVARDNADGADVILREIDKNQKETISYVDKRVDNILAKIKE